ncbi:MAG: GNAT family N-acetyltransferase [Synergistaceae bacterium]|jgi:N-acetylglutamate synthase-like GNAT family acetyltransferase|nr:GNAT family N-acetyltransferase [Synergistaceae bacterium]
MDPDDLVIRPAKPEEAELLSHMIFRARTYWDYPRELMDYWAERGDLSITPEEIEENPTYVAEDSDEALGFYSLETAEDGSSLIANLWVMPEYVGSEIPSSLFFHACELAKTSGSDCLFMISDPNAAAFYEEMGAERIGEKLAKFSEGQSALPVFRLRL